MSMQPDGDTLPDSNGYLLLIRAGEQIIGEIPRGGWYEQASAEELAAWIVPNRESLRLAAEGLATDSRVPLRFTREDFDVDRLSLFRLLARLLDAVARWAALEGRPDEAAARCLDLVRLGHAVSRGGLLIDRLTGEAIEGVGLAGLGRIAEALDAGTCRTAAGALEVHDSRREPLAETVDRDRRWDIAVHGDADGPAYYDKAADRIRRMPPAREAIARMPPTRPLECRRLATELAARAYILERSSAPVSPADLVPGYLTAAPLDPSGGLPLRGRFEADGRFSIERPG